MNDGDDEVETLAQWLSGRGAVLNLIPFNPFPASGLKRSSRERVGYSPEQDCHIPGMAGCEYIYKHFNRRDLSEKLALVIEDMRYSHG